VLRRGSASEVAEELQVAGERRRYIALRFPLMSEDGVATAVCTKLVDLSHIEGWAGERED